MSNEKRRRQNLKWNFHTMILVYTRMFYCNLEAVFPLKNTIVFLSPSRCYNKCVYCSSSPESWFSIVFLCIQDNFYASNYTKFIANAYDEDTTHTGGTSFLNGVTEYFASLFGNKRKNDYVVKDEDEGPPLGNYRWWALRIDKISRVLFPTTYFLLVTAYVCSYRVWEVFLQELQHED